MATTTVTELIERAAAAADMEDNFVTPEQWERWATVEHRRLASVVARLGYPYTSTETAITMTGATSYNIDEVLAILGVFWVETDGSYTRLEPNNPLQRAGAPNRSVGTPRVFNVIRNTNNVLTFSFYPNPASGSIIVKAVPHPAKLVISSPGAGEAVSVTYPLNWEERIVLGMARRALAKEETYNPFIETQIAEQDAHIESTAFDYLVGDAPRIRDIRKDNQKVYEWMYF